MTPLVIRNVEVGRDRTDVTVQHGCVVELGTSLVAPAGAEIIDGRGGALLPGLWDHHIHLLALAAARRSLVVGPPEVTTPGQFASALAAAAASDPGGWVRAVGYHESVDGDLDRDELDRLVPGTPVRIQHRSGAMWILNSSAIVRLGLDGVEHPGLERDGSERLTGRLYGADRLLRDRIGDSDDQAPDLALVGAELARYGVTGVTDATPYERLGDLRLLAESAATGAVPQRVVATGGPALAGASFPAPLGRGAVKLLLADHRLPSFDELVSWIRRAHEQRRPVAVHCVTRTSLVLFLAALEVAGATSGDRIEHGAVVPPELRAQLRAQHLTVVTQPNFVAERGDQYLADVDAEDRPHLYPCRSLVDAGIAVAGSTDAPFGHPDPWRAMVAATQRRTATGAYLGAGERVPAGDALRLFLGAPDDPGGAPRRVAKGAPADLCLLDAPLADVTEAPAAAHVRLTVIGGEIVHLR